MGRGLLAELLVVCSILQHSLVTFPAGASAQDLLHSSLAKSPAKDKGRGAPCDTPAVAHAAISSSMKLWLGSECCTS